MFLNWGTTALKTIAITAIATIISEMVIA